MLGFQGVRGLEVVTPFVVVPCEGCTRVVSNGVPTSCASVATDEQVEGLRWCLLS